MEYRRNQRHFILEMFIKEWGSLGCFLDQTRKCRMRLMPKYLHTLSFGSVWPRLQKGGGVMERKGEKGGGGSVEDGKQLESVSQASKKN